MGGQLCRCLGRALVPSLIPVEGQEHPLHPSLQIRAVEQFLGQRLCAVGRGHMAEPVCPPRSGPSMMPSVMITSCDLSAARIPDATLRPWQEQVPVMACPSRRWPCRRPLPICASSAITGKTMRPSQVLVARVPQDAQPGQPLADCCALLALVVGQAQAQRAINEADLEGRNGVLVFDCRVFGDSQGRRDSPLASRGVVVEHLAKGSLVIGVRAQQGNPSRRHRGFLLSGAPVAGPDSAASLPDFKSSKGMAGKIRRRSAAQTGSRCPWPPQLMHRHKPLPRVTRRDRIVILVEGTQANQVGGPPVSIPPPATGSRPPDPSPF